MRTLHLRLLLLGLLSSQTAFTQIVYPVSQASVNPLLHPVEISANREIALVFDEMDQNSNFNVKHKFFDVHQLNPNDLNTNIALQTNFPVYTGPVNAQNNRRIGTCSGDFNGDKIDDYVAGTEGPGNQIILRTYFAQVMGAQMAVNAGGIGPNTGQLTTSQGSAGFIRLASGNFDDVEDDEIVLLFREEGQDVLKLILFDLDEGLNMVQVATISDEAMTLAGSFESFDLQVVDLDYDGTDEVIIAGSQVVMSTRRPFVKVYDVQMSGPNGSFIPKEKTYVSTDWSSNTTVSVALTTGDFNHDFIEEIALAYGRVVPNNNGSTPDTFIRLFRVGDDTGTTPEPVDWLEKTVLLDAVFESVKSINYLQHLDLDAGDLDGDGREEIVLGTAEEIQLIKVTDNFTFQGYNAFGGSFSNDQDVYATQFITVGDMNNDGRAEVLNVRNWINMDNQEQHFSVNVYRWNPQTDAWQVLASNNYLMPAYYSGTTSSRRFSVAIGDFDGDNLFFGNYTHRVYTDVVQPIIILNAPPTHSDLLDGGFEDVNDVWPGLNCSNYEAIYSEENSMSFTVETTISNAWSVSASVSAEFDGLVASASASLSASYGENYANTNGTTQTTTEITTTTTCFDDAIYASIVTYDVYEYPLYVGDELVCHVVSIHPRMDGITFDWFTSKGEIGQYLVTQHEPGHLLSYRPFGAPQFDPNTIGASSLFSMSQNVFSLEPGINEEWSVTMEEGISQSAELTRSIGIEASASVGAFGVTAEVSGSYDWSSVSTHSSTVGEAISVGISVGGFPVESANAGYSIRPYIFWGAGNEVVLDYTVQANSPFYQQRYSIQDPAWNMPWRLDEERGYNLTYQTKTRQSKSIWFDNNFAWPGDTLMVNARVFNYSLVATESPVEVKFYFGNPYNGGVEITGTSGQTSVFTSSAIPAQQFEDVQMEIVLPENFPYDGRLYARIDPDSVMTEVHEENNLSWRWLGPLFSIVPDDYEGTTVGIQEYSSDDAFLLYPNPASERADILLGAMTPDLDAVIEVRDLGGRLMMIQPVTRGHMNALPVKDLPAGLYMVTLRTDEFRSSRRLVVE
jgi:hypothetical protein